jgi:hypothetical protein
MAGTEVATANSLLKWATQVGQADLMGMGWWMVRIWGILAQWTGR